MNVTKNDDDVVWFMIIYINPARASLIMIQITKYLSKSFIVEYNGDSVNMLGCYMIMIKNLKLNYYLRKR